MRDEYPKEMHHPHFKPAVLSVGPAMDLPGGPNQSRAARYPPVTVNSPDQEEWYASRGYASGRSLPQRHKDRENIRMRQAPEAETPETYEYPKYVGDKIAYSAEEEAAILATPIDAGEGCAEVDATYIVDPAELAEFRAWKAGRADERGTAEQAELLKLCAQAGIKADARFSVKRLRELLDAATAPVEMTAA